MKTFPFRRFHRLSALVLAAFLLAHMANHFAMFSGQATHQAFMAGLRPVYRHPLVEPILIALFAWQALSGLAMAWRGRAKRSGFVAYFQALTGVYLALFLIIHVAAVINGRMTGLDTDFRFAAAGMHVPPMQWFFAPYYFLAVFSLFGHAGCALYWNLPKLKESRRLAVLISLTLAGATFAAAIVASMAGVFHPVSIPAEYLASFGR